MEGYKFASQWNRIVFKAYASYIQHIFDPLFIDDLNNNKEVFKYCLPCQGHHCIRIIMCHLSGLILTRNVCEIIFQILATSPLLIVLVVSHEYVDNTESIITANVIRQYNERNGNKKNCQIELYTHSRILNFINKTVLFQI